MARSSSLSVVVRCAVLAGVAFCLAPASALAQPASASQFAESHAAPPTEDDDDTVWNLALQGAFNYGNARSLQLGASTHFMVRRDVHMFTLDLTFTYQSASVRDAMTQQFGEWNASAQNFNGRIRYDFFLDEDDSLFAVLAGRNDPFAGLDFRVQAQLGYMRNLFTEHEAEHRLWVEVGADVTYDDRYPNPLCSAPPSGVTVAPATCLGSDARSYLLPGDELQPSARLYLGYDNHMNAGWTYRTGVEGLIDLRGNPHWGNVRINWSNTVTLAIDSSLAANITFNMIYDGEPVPGRQELDTQTLVGLTYTLM